MRQCSAKQWLDFTERNLPPSHQDFQPLAVEVVPESADAGGIAAGMGQRAHRTLGDQIGRQGDDRTRVGRLLCSANRGITDAKDNVRGSLGQRRRDVRELIFAKIKATSNDLQVCPSTKPSTLSSSKNATSRGA